MQSVAANTANKFETRWADHKPGKKSSSKAYYFGIFAETWLEREVDGETVTIMVRALVDLIPGHAELDDIVARVGKDGEEVDLTDEEEEWVESGLIDEAFEYARGDE